MGNFHHVSAPIRVVSTYSVFKICSQTFHVLSFVDMINNLTHKWIQVKLSLFCMLSNFNPDPVFLSESLRALDPQLEDWVSMSKSEASASSTDPARDG